MRIARRLITGLIALLALLWTGLAVYAYWPGEPEEYFDDLATDRARELARYAAVIHLQPPTRENGYLSTGLRYETAEQAATIDARTLAAWDGHPHRHVVPSSADFLVKLRRTLDLLREEIPACCRR